MTQKERELLLKDRCARLPYGVLIHIRYKEVEPCYGKLTPIDIQWFIDSKIEDIKPYLRPMSSMTEEEKKDFPFPYYFEWIDSNFSLLCSNDEVCASIGFDEMYEIMDWLNAHHFDYRNLIEKGLALETLGDMYKID